VPRRSVHVGSSKATSYSCFVSYFACHLLSRKVLKRPNLSRVRGGAQSRSPPDPREEPGAFKADVAGYRQSGKGNEAFGPPPARDDALVSSRTKYNFLQLPVEQFHPSPVETVSSATTPSCPLPRMAAPARRRRPPTLAVASCGVKRSGVWCGVVCGMVLCSIVCGVVCSVVCSIVQGIVYRVYRL
jgi:hypothetical protein